IIIIIKESLSLSLRFQERVKKIFCEMLARAPPPSFVIGERSCGVFRNGGGVITRAGFTRRPLEASCSNEVVSDSTDDGFIVIKAEHRETELYPPPPPPPSIPPIFEKKWFAFERSNREFREAKGAESEALVGKVTQKKQQVSRNEEEEDEDDDIFEDEEFELAMKAIPSSGKSSEVKRFSRVRESRELRDTDRSQTNERDSNGYAAANSRGRGDRPSNAKNLDTFKGSDRAAGEFANPRKFSDNERAGSRSSYSKDSSAANSRGREDRRFVNKESDTYQRRDRATTDEFSDARYFNDNERAGSHYSYSRGGAGNSRGWVIGVLLYTQEIWRIGEREGIKPSLLGKPAFLAAKVLQQGMMKALKENNFDRPAHIQALAFAPVVDGKSCIIADQSGSGKTLAYLVPVIQRLREEELQGLSKSSSGCPRVIVLVPTAELASQVLANCRLISKSGVPFRSMVVTGGFQTTNPARKFRARCGRFDCNTRAAILDEVDILFGDEEFDICFCTATLPLEIYNKLVEVFPDCEVVMGPRVHRVSNALEEVLVDCSGDDYAEKTPETAFQNKKAALLQIIEENPVAKTIIFCNKIETCRKVENIFKRLDRNERQLHVLPFHAALAQGARLTNMEEFTSSHPEDHSLFLVCTDRASRGIDFSGVDHVVLFDFPRDPSEYVRRVGRTARGARGEGKAFVFVVGKQVTLARRIIERNQKGHPVHDVPNAYEFTT
ncbi:hypothetical protein HID58_069225, partial [Brassica napus]